MTESGKSQKNCGQEDRREHKTLPLFLLFLILALCTSCAVGYILGKKSDPVPGGQLIDTILLTPEAEKKEVASLHLTGRVVYSDGAPAAGRLMELRSEPVVTRTDSAGAFLFDNVPLGRHRLSVMNEDGTVAAQRNLALDRNPALKGLSIDVSETGQYLVKLSMDVRMLEFSLELDEETYYIQMERITYATADGRVVTPSGEASVSEGPVVTPAGNVCMPDGTIVLPGSRASDPAAVILPDDSVVFPSENLAAGDAMITPEGTVNLADGTVIRPGGQIQRPDGTVSAPGEKGVIVTETDVVPIGGRGGQRPPGPPQEETSAGGGDTDANPEAPGSPSLERQPSSEEHTLPETGNETGPRGTQAETSASGGGGHSGGGGSGGGQNGSINHESSESAGTTGSDESPGETGGTESAGSAEDTDKGTLDVLGQLQDSEAYISWTQTRDIDLFYNRYEGSDGDLIVPGSRGYYQFRLKNTRQEPLAVTLTLTEGSDRHLPLDFTLTPKAGTKLWQRGQAVHGTLKGYETELKLRTEIDAGSETDFRLEWEWPPDGNDGEDTVSGLESGEYILTLTLNAQGGQ